MGMNLLRPKNRRGLSRRDDCVEKPVSTLQLRSGYRAASPFREHRFLAPSGCLATLHTHMSRQREESMCTMHQCWKDAHPTELDHDYFRMNSQYRYQRLLGLLLQP